MLYGKVTIGRNRLAITDNDAAEHGPFDCCRATMDCYVLSKHMLCVFHGVILKFNENIHPILPRTRGQHHLPLRQRKLTKKSHLYGESCHVSCPLCSCPGRTHIGLCRQTLNGRTKKRPVQICIQIHISAIFLSRTKTHRYCQGRSYRHNIVQDRFLSEVVIACVLCPDSDRRPVRHTSASLFCTARAEITHRTRICPRRIPNVNGDD